MGASSCLCGSGGVCDSSILFGKAAVIATFVNQPRVKQVFIRSKEKASVYRYEG